MNATWPPDMSLSSEEEMRRFVQSELKKYQKAKTLLVPTYNAHPLKHTRTCPLTAVVRNAEPARLAPCCCLH